MENDTSLNKEETVEHITVPEEGKLSRRDALEVAIAAHEEPTPAEPVKVEEAPVVEEKKEPEMFVPPLEPPAEWTKDEKEDFRQMSRRSQEAAIRVHQGRAAKLEEIKRESAELQWAKDLVKQTQQFYQARGERVPSPKDIIHSLQVVNDLDGQTAKTIRGVLEAKGLPVPKELMDDHSEKNDIQEALAPVLQEVASLKEEKARKEQEERDSIFQSYWSDFEQSKNAAGAPKYADIQGTSESALRLAREIGSLVYDDTPLARNFVEKVKARIPDLTPQKLFEEAYRFCGGKVDESPAPKTDPQEHLRKSNTAALSVPGRGSSNGFTAPAKKLSRREWLAQCIEMDNQSK